VDQRLDDLQVYRRLHRLVEELDGLAAQCHSVAAATAIKAAAALVKATASGLYKHSLEAVAQDSVKVAENSGKV
jgi:hypothetical protein